MMEPAGRAGSHGRAFPNGAKDTRDSRAGVAFIMGREKV